MPQLQKFLDALSLLPGVLRARQKADRLWASRAPIQLEFALVGGQIAQDLLSYSDDERAYLRGVLSYGLTNASSRLRNLVLCPLLSTLFAQARRIGLLHEQAVLHHLYVTEQCGATQNDGDGARLLARADELVSSRAHARDMNVIDPALLRTFPPPSAAQTPDVDEAAEQNLTIPKQQD